MPYLIDGHNLIPKLPGFSLEQIDDEERLVAVLQVYQRMRRQSVEVFFDRSPAGRARLQKAGSLVVRWVRDGKTADSAIIDRLRTLGKAARNWTVVSSDRQVQSEAHALGAAYRTSEQFAGEIQQAQTAAQQQSKENPPVMNPEDVAQWLEIFRESRKNKPKTP
jgi:predicted RNA-binding protein with PIN domain